MKKKELTSKPQKNKDVSGYQTRERRWIKKSRRLVRYTRIKQKRPTKCPLLINFHLANKPYSNSPKANTFNVRLKNPSLHFSVHWKNARNVDKCESSCINAKTKGNSCQLSTKQSNKEKRTIEIVKKACEIHRY